MMKRSSSFLVVIIAVVPLSACPAKTDPQPHTSTTTPVLAQSSTCAPVEKLAEMDGRKPVPLQPMMAWHQKQNMMAHLEAIQGITAALAEEDWEGVAKASSAIESSPQMQQMCEHMGAGAAGFTELALAFHQKADAIAVAAQAKDMKAVLTATSATLQTCTQCHATYRQDVVDAATFEARTGSAHDPAAMHGGGGMKHPHGGMAHPR